MKIFAITKTGYSAGVYGCSAEHFTIIWVDDSGLHSENFSGLYGAEQRVAQVLKDAGYTEQYVYSNYGKIPQKEVRNKTASESRMIEELKTYLQEGK